ncbi:hypothetical protein FKP32DRAFT_737251 [Trametes sanguinea]|nr:hypothetical protein FKP32DRAFT_737251 [Trametes sanguinea]
MNVTVPAARERVAMGIGSVQGEWSKSSLLRLDALGAPPTPNERFPWSRDVRAFSSMGASPGPRLTPNSIAGQLPVETSHTHTGRTPPHAQLRYISITMHQVALRSRLPWCFPLRGPESSPSPSHPCRWDRLARNPVEIQRVVPWDQDDGPLQYRTAVNFTGLPQSDILDSLEETAF